MKILITVLLPVFILLVMESCARTLVTFRNDLRAPVEAVHKEAVPSRQLGWERAPSFEGRLGYDYGTSIRKHDAQGFLAYDTAQIADTKTPRIIAIGDSNTYGWGVSPESAWVEVLDRALPNANVINLGYLGYTSFQGYHSLLKHGDQLKPAMILASFNFNDRAYVYDRKIDSEAKFAQHYDATQKGGRYDWLNKIYMTWILRSAMHKLGLLRSDPPVDVDVRQLDARVPPENYRENLRKIAEYGRARNIPVVFILLKDNPYYTNHIHTGIEHRRSGQYERAVRAFTIGTTNVTSGTLARKYLAHTYEDMGASEKAKETGRHERQKESLGGGHPIYLDAEYNRIMIDVGREFGIKVVDARAMLDADPDVFIDMCHPDEVGHARIAELVLQAVKQVTPELATGTVQPATDRTAQHRGPQR